MSQRPKRRQGIPFNGFCIAIDRVCQAGIESDTATGEEVAARIFGATRVSISGASNNHDNQDHTNKNDTPEPNSNSNVL
jgi:hypothetical protein